MLIVCNLLRDGLKGQPVEWLFCSDCDAVFTNVDGPMESFIIEGTQQVVCCIHVPPKNWRPFYSNNAEFSRQLIVHVTTPLHGSQITHHVASVAGPPIGIVRIRATQHGINRNSNMWTWGLKEPSRFTPRRWIAPMLGPIHTIPTCMRHSMC